MRVETSCKGDSVEESMTAKDIHVLGLVARGRSLSTRKDLLPLLETEEARKTGVALAELKEGQPITQETKYVKLAGMFLGRDWRRDG